MPTAQLLLDLLDPLDWMVHLAFLVPQGPLEQQVSLDSEDRRETVGSWPLQKGDKRAPVFLAGSSLTLALTPCRLTPHRVIRGILESEAHLARLGSLVSQDQWDQWDLPDHQGPQAPHTALMTLL